MFQRTWNAWPTEWGFISPTWNSKVSQQFYHCIQHHARWWRVDNALWKLHTITYMHAYKPVWVGKYFESRSQVESTFCVSVDSVHHGDSQGYSRNRIIREKLHSSWAKDSSASNELIRLNPDVKGLSTRSVRQFCEKFGIHASSRLSNSELDRMVSSSVSKVRWDDCFLHFHRCDLNYCRPPI